MPTGPRIVHHTTKAHKTVDTEDTDLKCLKQSDGTLVTERKQTTEHEELFDEELPEKDDNSTGSRERVDHTVNIFGGIICFEILGRFFTNILSNFRNHRNDFSSSATNRQWSMLQMVKS